MPPHLTPGCVQHWSSPRARLLVQRATWWRRQTQRLQQVLVAHAQAVPGRRAQPQQRAVHAKSKGSRPGVSGWLNVGALDPVKLGVLLLICCASLLLPPGSVHHLAMPGVGAYWQLWPQHSTS